MLRCRYPRMVTAFVNGQPVYSGKNRTTHQAIASNRSRRVGFFSASKLNDANERCFMRKGR
jgi:hypothetical protein